MCFINQEFCTICPGESGRDIVICPLGQNGTICIKSDGLVETITVLKITDGIRTRKALKLFDIMEIKQVEKIYCICSDNIGVVESSKSSESSESSE